MDLMTCGRSYLARLLQLRGQSPRGGGGGAVLPYMSYIGMCRCEGYGL